MRHLIIFLSIALLGNAGAAVIYVDADATAGGDGSSWASAFNYLQDALDQTVASRGDEVWIAEGTYFPDDGASVTDGDRAASFTLKDGVALYGGFVGTETSLAERDWEAYVTTLSGKIFTEQIYWSLHVCTVVATASVTFDGVTVTGGNANEYGSSAGGDQAAAVYCSSSSYQVAVSNSSFSENTANNHGGVAYEGTWTVSNSSFSGNSAWKGGVARYGTWTVTNSSFSGNSASNYGGVASDGNWTVSNSSFSGNSGDGGVASGGTWTVNNSIFSGNTGEVGGVASGGTSWTVTNSSFSENTATYYGGVAYGGTWTVTNSSFSGNSAALGGVTYDGTSWTVTNSSFSGNSATGYGAISGDGGVAYGYHCTWTVSNSSFSGNTAALGGVASDGNWTVTNSTFSGNSASSSGGVARYGTWTVTNSTFSGNSASSSGGVANSGTWTVSNSIFDATNTSSDNTLFFTMNKFSNLTGTSPSPTSPRSASIIEGGLAVINMYTGIAIELGTGYVIDADPLFVDASDPDGADDIWGTADDGLRLQAGSPAIGQGNTDSLPFDTLDVDDDGVTDEPVPLDLAGFLRIQDGSLDLGAYEYGNSAEQLFTLTTAAGTGGSISPAGTQNYSDGASETLTASPSAGYLFDA